MRFESGTETEAFEIRAGVERIELIDRSGLLVAEIRRADRARRCVIRADRSAG
ncbi:MAG: hypothetical protein R3E53_15100 [Myxococcota bacterium]